MIKLIKNFLKYRLGNGLIRIKTLRYRIFKDKSFKIFILGVAEHGNFGDFAISEAQHQFIDDHFNVKVIEFTEENMSNPLIFKLIEQMLNANDIIFCQGGGNHGNIYKFHEGYRREVIKRFTNNRIVIFPQTYYFSDDEDGKREAAISKEIYNSHPDLIFALRDSVSYSLAKETYTKPTVIYCPDMVLYLMNNYKKFEPDGSLMVILRSGLESFFSTEEKKRVVEKLKEKYVVKTSNHSTDMPITISNRASLIKNQVELYSKSNVVITDKLHGAIFSILTGTPCVMLKTFNHKLQEVAKVFTPYDGYYLCTEAEQILECVDKAYPIKKCQNPDITKYYEDFFKTIIS